MISTELVSDRVTAYTQGRPFVPPEPPRTPKSSRTRRRLLDLAADLFIERGYAAVSIRDIASAAQLTNGAVYGHFRSKGQLFVEVIRWKLAERDEAIDFTKAAADPERAVELMYDERYRDIRLLEVDAAAAARHDPDVAAGLAELYGERNQRIRDAVGDVRDPDSATWLIVALVAGIGMREAIGLPVSDHDGVRAALLDVIASLA